MSSRKTMFLKFFLAQPHNYYTILTALLASFALHSAAAAEVDIAAGAKVYEARCAKCHTITKPMNHKKGPSFLGIVGRSSARVSGYKYSEAMRSANLTWTSQKLDQFLIAPKVVVPGNKMKFKGMPSAEDRNNLIEFLILQQ